MFSSGCLSRAFRVSVAVLVLLLAAPADAGPKGSGGVNDPALRDKPYIVLFSIDGFRWDFAEMVETPAMDFLAENGLRAEALQPVFPTLTFPNHYSIATGALPTNHGIIANEFPNRDRSRWYHYKDRETVQDGGWYRRDPIWVTAERRGMVTAAYFFVGTEADVSGIRPTHWRAFNAEDSDESRVQQVLDWLAEPPESRPHLLTLYTEDVDDHTHWHGPGSPESLASIARVDQRLQQLLDGIAKLPHGDQVYVIMVSDHGQAGYDSDQPALVIDEVADLSGVRAVEGGPFVYLYFSPEEKRRVLQVRDAINGSWNCGRALTPADAPPGWRIQGDRRFADLIVQADPGCGVISRGGLAHKMTPGDHGWAPEIPEMRGILYAFGPRIPAGARPGRVHVTDVYPMMLEILGLEAPHAMDGDPERLPSLLSPVR
jgi:arylsulfatase A-like enzyme